jgi:DNA-binding response OmpR family regulator
MAQAPRFVPSSDPDRSSSGQSLYARLTGSAGWLVLEEPHGPIDLARLFPSEDVRVEADPAAFFEALSAGAPSVVVLLVPPAGPGDVERVAGWRTAHRNTCLILLSAHRAVAVRLQALELGFDDAIDLASDPMEIVGRLSIGGRDRAAGRDAAAVGRSDGAITLGRGIELDLRARAIRRDGTLISLRPQELALIEFLATHPSRAFSRRELLQSVWRDATANERTVDVYVFWLRAKVERDPARPVRLVTVRGSGYRFDPPAAETRLMDASLPE